MSLEPRTFERIASEFSEAEQALVIELLGYSGPMVDDIIAKWGTNKWPRRAPIISR